MKITQGGCTSFVKDGAVLLTAMGVCGMLSGCVVVGGTSRGGFFIWPGGLGLLLIILLVVFLLRRR